MGGLPTKILEEFSHPDFVKKLKAGNDSAYRQLVDGILPRVKNFVKRRYGFSEEEAKDLAQNFFQRLVEKIDQYDANEGRFLAWAFQILRNLAVDWLRRYKRLEMISFDSLQIDKIVPSLEDDLLTTPKDDLSPLEKLPPEVRTAILRLNDRYQQFVGLMLLGKSDETIRQVLNIASEGALWTLRSRVITKLKEEVEKITTQQGGHS